MRFGTRAAVVLMPLVLVLTVRPASAEITPHRGLSSVESDCAVAVSDCVAAAGGAFTVTGASRQGRGVSPDGQPHAEGSVPEPTIITEQIYTPTCSGNRPDVGDSLCSLASMSCPVKGEVAFWAFVRTRNTVTGAVGPWARVAVPPSVCMSLTDPVLDPRAAIPALVERDFQRLVVKEGVTSVQPAGRTLVNVDTIFYTSTERSYIIPNVVILGTPVYITATARAYTWYFGDGTTLTTNDPGRRGEKVVSHRYTKAAAAAPFVEIEWGGTYRIGSDPKVLQVRGTARTTGAPTPLSVLGARTQLEATAG